MDLIVNKVLESPTENNIDFLLTKMKEEKMYSTCILIGEYFSSIYPYNLKILNDIIFCSYKCKNYKTIYDTYCKIIKYTEMKETEEIINKREELIPYIEDEMIEYSEKKIKYITKNISNNINFISFLIDISDMENYKNVINSFINCCKDKNKISNWYILDNIYTSEIVKKEIFSNYPFLNFIKDLNEIKGEYIFYIKNNNLFFEKKNYITECLYVMNRSNTQKCFYRKTEGENILKQNNSIKYFITNNKNNFPCLLTKDIFLREISEQSENSGFIENIKNNEDELEELLNEINKKNILQNQQTNDKYTNLFNAHISCFYHNEKKLGNKIGKFLIENNINIHRERMLSNHLFYIKKLKEVFDVNVYEPKNKHLEIENPKEEYKGFKYNILNPSIFLDNNNDIWLNIRNVSFEGKNYTPMSSDNIVKTRNIFGKIINKNIFNIETEYEIKDSANYPKIDNRVLGFEDLKIFRYKDRWCFTCTSYEAAKSTNVLFGRLDVNHQSNNTWETHDVIVLEGDMTSENRPEKNWMPILSNDEEDLHIVYSVFPNLHIVKLNEKNKKVETVINKKWKKDLGFFRGSSCLVPYIYNNFSGYIFVTHEVFFISNERHYIHRVLWISKEYNNMYYSDYFFFENNSKIEYCNGVIYDKNSNLVYLSYGDDDKKAKVLSIHKDNIDKMLSENNISNMVFTKTSSLI